MWLACKKVAAPTGIARSQLASNDCLCFSQATEGTVIDGSQMEFVCKTDKLRSAPNVRCLMVVLENEDSGSGSTPKASDCPARLPVAIGNALLVQGGEFGEAPEMRAIAA